MLYRSYLIEVIEKMNHLDQCVLVFGKTAEDKMRLKTVLMVTEGNERLL